MTRFLWMFRPALPELGKLWEMRGRGKSGIARNLYVTVRGRRVVIVQAFVKKTQRTPREEVETALQRAREAV